MRGYDILSGQPIDPATAARARELRRQMTHAEQAVWQAVRANRLDGLHFRRQQVVRGFIVDFYCHAARFVVEVDGPIHRHQVEADEERYLVLTGLGLAVLHVTNEEVEQDLRGVLRRLRTAVQSRRPGRDSPFPRGEGG